MKRTIYAETHEVHDVSQTMSRIRGYAQGWAKRTGYSSNAERESASGVLARLGLDRETVQRAARRMNTERLVEAVRERRNIPMPTKVASGRITLPASAFPPSAERARELAGVADSRPGIQWRRLARWLRHVADEMDGGREITLIYVWAKENSICPSHLYAAWREVRDYKGVSR